MKSEKSSQPVGRPRAFDKEQALEAALQVFWAKGYEGTSLSDLTEAMGINRPSLYAAFGNKEELFRQVLDRYSTGPVAFRQEALNAPTAREVAEKLLNGTVCAATMSCYPHGCLGLQSALVTGDEAEPIRRELVSRRAVGAEAIRQRFERAKSEGDLPADADTDALARYIVSVMYGLAVQATGGTTAEELSPVVETALRAWPT